MVYTKKIIEELLPGVTISKKQKTKPTEYEEGDEPHIDKRLYYAERCEDKTIHVEEGVTYYEGEIDTSEIVEDILTRLKRKGMI